MKIVYNKPEEVEEFDKERYLNSLRKYGEINEAEAERMIDEKITAFPIRHVSVLVEEAVPLFKKEDDARRYWEEHKGDGRNFDRLRRICGYLVGSLDRWNSAKRQEESQRLKHNVETQFAQQNEYQKLDFS